MCAAAEGEEDLVGEWEAALGQYARDTWELESSVAGVGGEEGGGGVLLSLNWLLKCHPTSTRDCISIHSTTQPHMLHSRKCHPTTERDNVFIDGGWASCVYRVYRFHWWWEGIIRNSPCLPGYHPHTTPHTTPRHEDTRALAARAGEGMQGAGTAGRQRPPAPSGHRRRRCGCSLARSLSCSFLLPPPAPSGLRRRWVVSELSWAPLLPLALSLPRSSLSLFLFPAPPSRSFSSPPWGKAVGLMLAVRQAASSASSGP